jgi:hypothetical protein
MFVFASAIAGTWLISSDFHDDDMSLGNELVKERPHGFAIAKQHRTYRALRLLAD